MPSDKKENILTLFLCVSRLVSLLSVSPLGEDVARSISPEMFLNGISSALLPWLLWLSFLPIPAAPTTGSAPTSPPPPHNTTLLFDVGAPAYSLRNCSCSSPVRDCDEALANMLCSCRTVPRSALPPAGLEVPGGRLSVWLREHWPLEELLNGSCVGHLRLSFCGVKPQESRYLVLFGLRSLTIHSATPGAPYPDQEITIGGAAEVEPLSSSSSSILHMTFMDVAVLNGLSALKAYTVVGPPAPGLSRHFPHLPLPSSAEPSEHREPQQNCLLTFVY